jgi:hypothetical protein
MALQFYVKTAREDVAEALIGMARQADESACILLDLIERRLPFTLCRTHLHPGDKAAEVLIPLAGLDQQRICNSVRARDLRPDVRRDSGLLRREVEARRAVDAVAVHDRHCGHAVLSGCPGELLGERRAFQEGECRTGVKLDVH